MCGKRYLPLNVIRGEALVCLFMLFAPEPSPSIQHKMHAPLKMRASCVAPACLLLR